jgi:transcriptional regulator with XRE-family HTH domain
VGPLDPDTIDPKAIRTARNWSQTQMAEYLGCDQSTVSRIEAGASPSGPILRLLELLVADEERAA